MELIVTNDGSHSIFLPKLNETYHSRSGAIAESNHVYIQYGLEYFLNKKSIAILELGLGTGLNALLSLQKASENKLVIDYTSLEPYPLDNKIINQLNYSDLLSISKADFIQIHDSKIGEKVALSNYFNHKRLDAKFEELNIFNNQFDLIYFDAFAPSKQADVWEIEAIQKTFDLLKENGLLVTYCAQGQFKRNLKSVGFRVENKPGPHEKREITLGFKEI